MNKIKLLTLTMCTLTLIGFTGCSHQRSTSETSGSLPFESQGEVFTSSAANIESESADTSFESLTWDDQTTDTVDLAIVDGIPTILQGGSLYQYQSDENWIQLEDTGRVMQVISDDYLVYLDEEGHLHNEEALAALQKEMSEETVINNSLGAYASYLEQIEELNREHPIARINGAPGGEGFKALLANNRVFFCDTSGNKFFELPEKVTDMNGSLVLTEYGNVYEIFHNRVTTGAWNWICDPLHLGDGGPNNATGIDAGGLGSVVLTWRGRAVLLSDRKETPDISGWKQLTDVVHGYNFVAALTKEGKVLFSHYSEEYNEDILAIVSEWSDIIAIEDYYQGLYAVDKNGKCYGVNFEKMSQNVPGDCFAIEF